MGASLKRPARHAAPGFHAKPGAIFRYAAGEIHRAQIRPFRAASQVSAHRPSVYSLALPKAHLMLRRNAKHRIASAPIAAYRIAAKR